VAGAPEHLARSGRLRAGRSGLHLLPLTIALTTLAVAAFPQETQGSRDRMVARIEAYVGVTPGWAIGDGFDAAVLEAMRRTPRHAFVPAEVQGDAYDDRPLPIGFGQTISQPFIVALMTELLEVDRNDAVLEVGTGSGYHAAILAQVAGEVRSIEIVPALGERAADTLRSLGYANVETRVGDGYYGWPEHAPFDGIVVTAAASHIPPPLVEQLAPGGRMVIPIGSAFATQQLMLVEKRADGTLTTRQLLPVRFVPLTRAE
jgi:protein-L-isoaspartate(D-aspartate) O-methyltransferase